MNKQRAEKFRRVISDSLDLCDQEDPLDLARMLGSLAQSFEHIHTRDQSEKARRALNDAVAPWFDCKQLELQ